MRILDADTHFMEPFSVYTDHVAPGDRDLALRVERDARGWPWLAHRGRRLHRIDAHLPGRVEHVGEQRQRFEAGDAWRESPPIPDPWDPAARIRVLDENGVDGSLVFPNLGLSWEQELRDDVPSLHANLAAYNTFVLEQLPDCGDRLFPAAHVALHDLDWFEREIRRCARAGIRLAMLGPQPYAGRALGHPDCDRAWALLADEGVALCFHVSAVEPPLDPAWYALDPARENRLLDMIFLHLPAAVAVTHLIVHGALERFPGLRIGIVELSAGWVPGYLLHLDGAWEFYRRQNGAPLRELPLRPSEYFRRQVRVNAFPLEGAARLMELTGAQVFMWGSDYPHAEGMTRPSWRDYLRVQPRRLSEDEQASLGGGNAAFLLFGQTPEAPAGTAQTPGASARGAGE